MAKAKKKGTSKQSVKTVNMISDSPYSTEKREDYEAKDAMRTMSRALEIQGNKGLMSRVRKHAKGEAERHARVARLDGKPL